MIKAPIDVWERNRLFDEFFKKNDNRLFDALGNPLSNDPFTRGTFYRPPEADPLSDITKALEAMRKAEYSPQLDKPKRIDLGDGVAISGFWLSIQDVTFRRLPPDLDHYGFPISEGELSIRALVPDRDTGKPVEITFNYRFPVAAWESQPARRPELLQAVIRKWLSHELDEHIYVDGVRLRDPHAPAERTFYFPIEELK